MTGSDWIALIGGGAALVGAAVAIWQAIEARRARRDAEASSVRAAAVAEEANAAWKSMAESQKVVALAHRPKAWGELKHHSGDLWTIRNSSERSIVVQAIEAQPASAQPLLEVEGGGDLPRLYRRGELLEFMAHARSGLSVRTIRIVWNFADENGVTHDSDRPLRGERASSLGRR